MVDTNTIKIMFLITLLTISSIVHSQYTADKQKHLFAGAIISYAVAPIAWKITGKKNLSSIVGFSCGALAGLLKEKYDQNNDGVMSRKDIGYTLLGSVIGAISFRIIINRSIRKKR